MSHTHIDEAMVSALDRALGDLFRQGMLQVV
jgi:hypothetical protein